MPLKNRSRPSFFTSFKRSQVASVIATAVDFFSLVFLVEVAGVYYVFATAMGALIGALTHFLLGRHWSFEATDATPYGQAIRYGLVATFSLLLNSSGVFLFTDRFGLNYSVSKIITAVLVGVFFNFPLHRHFVFQKVITDSNGVQE